MSDKLKVEEIRNTFSVEPFSTNDLYDFYEKYDPNLKKNTFRWRVHRLKNDGIINVLKRGVYTTKNKKVFRPVLSDKLKTLFSEVQSRYPYVDMCIWETSWLNDFTVHQVFSNDMIIEIEKAAAHATFALLQESYRAVFLNPKENIVVNYITGRQRNMIIKNLTVTSPMQIVDGIKIPSIEKIMVDLFTDDELYISYQGAELQNIYQEIFGAYNVNQSTLKQYANKRHVKDKMISFIKEETDIDNAEILI